MLIAGAVGLSSQGAHAQADAAPMRTRAPQPRLAAKPPADLPFRSIAASAEDLTLRGEFASTERTVFLSPTDALRAQAFRVGFSNTVSNLPEVSRLSVRINDQLIGDIALNATTETGQAVFAIPPGVLVPGVNAIRFTANQRHRVDCSIDATYELWTQISPAHTGLVNIAPTPSVRGLAELPMLAGLAAGRTPIRLRLPDGFDTAALDQAMRAANALILAGAIMHPSIEVASTPGTGPGIDLVLGGVSPAGAGLRLAPEIGLYINQESDPSRAVVSIIGSPEIDLNLSIRRLEAFAAQAERPGSRAGQRALANLIGRRIGNGSSLTFGDLGLETRAFDGHLMQMSSRLVLPADFFPAPHGAARLTLDSSFAGRASLDQRISVSINDQVAAIVPIMNPGRGGLNGRTIELPLESFKPGANIVTVEALMSDAKAACDATLAHAPAARLIIGAGSSISFDRLARAASYPNLSATLGLSLPYTDADTPLAIGVSARDPAYLDGALTMIGRMVASAQMPLNTSFRFRPLDNAAEAGIFFGAPSEAPREPSGLGTPVAGGAGDQPANVATARTRLAAAAGEGTTQTDGTAQSLIPGISSPATASDLVRSAGGATDGASRNWLPKASDLRGIATWLENFGLLDKARDGNAARSFDDTTDALEIRQTAQRHGGSSALSAFFEPSTRPVVQTAVLGADPAAFVALVEKATTDQFWSRLNGEAARVRIDDWGPTNLGVQERVYSAISDRSPGNIRLVAAGWLSLNPSYYLAILGGLVALLALTTTIALRARRA
ncbi:cyclic di-GMP binding protein precursor [Bosea sp. BIWAKO-01]|nr:cyclic di-GMP binding protein precursor [Bosea sp. BIWAKO-01]